MDDAEARQRLEDERARLAEVRNGLNEGNSLDESEGESLAELSSIDQHQADLGTETFEREKDLSILENVEAELADIEHALSRLNDGTYGTCEACGRPIDEDRLEAMPATRLCVQDQAQAERQARAGGIE
ncbi:MAG TPA: TraR/DksA C4-type zinc finger protein [Acidimicrobiales bacterium]|nr:TraR/DksA C4-type zinc finger protein [Acidimicrobiales bacterium]